MKDTPTMMALVAKVGPQLDKFVTQRFPLTQVQDAWTLQLTGKSAKILLKPWETSS
jgi:Zn-dependent alcohol dehydrogenase